MGRNKKRELIKDEFIKYLRDVYNLALYYTRDRDKADDLTQETYARALGYIDSYTPNTNAKSFLFKILTSIFYNHQERLNTERNNIEYRAFMGDDGSEIIGRDFIIAENEEDRFLKEYSSREVERLLLNLSFEHRTILVLADIEEFSYEEISKILNIPIGTVMSRLSRARNAFKKELKKRMEIIEKESSGANIVDYRKDLRNFKN